MESSAYSAYMSELGTSQNLLPTMHWQMGVIPDRRFPVKRYLFILVP